MMTPDAPSTQLNLELRQSVQTALATKRPLLHHLNADSSWLLQIPRPASATRNCASRFYYNILIDPWLSGGQSDVASWFSQQFHATKSAVASIAELEELARESEALARGRQQQSTHQTIDASSDSGYDDDDLPAQETLIDCVAVSHEFTDHCHKDTLLELHPDVPVLAIPEAAALIDRWNHFRTVLRVPVFDSDWRYSSLPPLPDWLGISRLVAPGDALNYHAALLIAFSNGHPSPHTAAPTATTTTTRRARAPKLTPAGPQDPPTECLLYTPHGIPPLPTLALTHATPPLTPLALLHGLHHIRVGTFFNRTALQSNLGAHNGLAVQRALRARYWVGTHDEVKEGRGVVGWLIRRWEVSLGEAVRGEVGSGKGGKVGKGGEDEGGDVVMGEEGEGGCWEGVNWCEVGNGGSRVLV